MSGRPNQGWRFMDLLPTRMPYGNPVTGSIGEGIGFGPLATGRDVRGLMPIGSPVTGNREDGVGSGFPVAGKIDK